MKIKTIVTSLLTSAFLLICSSSAFAGEVDVLIEKLVEKKILTESEAEDIVQEIKKEDEKAEKPASSWAEKVKLKGDFRLRYQSEEFENDSNPARKRGRVRARIGIEAKPADKWEAGLGLASGGSDPRSTNQTLENTFDTPDIRLDYAYAKFSPTDSISLLGGKIKNPVWGTKDLLWDSDIRPEGVAAEYSFKANDNFEFFVTPAYFILEEYRASTNPTMFLIQPGVSWKIGKNLNTKFALGYYNFSNIKGNDFTANGAHGEGTNSRDIDGNWMYNYKSITADAEVAFYLPALFEYGALFGQYVKTDAGDSPDDTGYLIGLKVGDKSVKTLGAWQFKYNYRRLEKDAWPDWMSDSDFYGGLTGVKGSEYEFKLGLTKNVTFALDYYQAKPILAEDGPEQKLFQADLEVKF